MQKLFLSSVEYADLEEIREIKEFRLKKINNRNCLRVRVDVPIIGQKYNFGSRDIYDLFLIGRHNDTDVRNLDEFPVHVHVFIPIDLDDLSKIKPWKEMYNIGWACIYNNRKDAERKIV